MENNKLFTKISSKVKLHPFTILQQKILNSKPIYPVGLSASGFQKAWQEKLTGKNVKVAVLDTGIDSSHPDLINKVIYKYDFYFNDKRLHPHGTHVAGIICAQGKGVYGGAPNVSLLDIRVLNGDGEGNLTYLAQAIRLATDKGAKIINMSLGASGLLPNEIKILQDAVNYAWNKNVICVGACGNSGTSINSIDKLEYPASIDKVISVSACSVDKTLNNINVMYFSNENNMVDVASIGSNVYSCVPNAGYELWSGTSMATPYVSAFLALLASKYSTIDKIITNLNQHIIKKEPNISYGKGFIRYKPNTGPSNISNLQPVYYNGIYYGNK